MALVDGFKLFYETHKYCEVQFKLNIWMLITSQTFKNNY